MGFSWRLAEVTRQETCRGLTWGLLLLHSSGFSLFSIIQKEFFFFIPRIFPHWRQPTLVDCAPLLPNLYPRLSWLSHVPYRTLELLPELDLPGSLINPNWSKIRHVERDVPTPGVLVSPNGRIGSFPYRIFVSQSSRLFRPVET